MTSTRNTATIFCREFKSYFESPVAYVFLVVFLLLTGFMTFSVGSFFLYEVYHRLGGLGGLFVVHIKKRFPKIRVIKYRFGNIHVHAHKGIPGLKNYLGIFSFITVLYIV